MPDMSGTDLLAWTKKNSPTPLILMTGYSDVIEAQAAYQLGAQEFLSKPFALKDLEQAITGCLGTSARGTVSESSLDAQFRGFSIDTPVNYSLLGVDLYIRLSATKYLKVFHGAQSHYDDQIIHCRDRGITKIYVRVEDLAKIKPR